MIREKVTQKSTSGNKGFLLVIALSVGIIVLSSIVGYIENTFDIKHLELIIYAILVFVSTVLIRRYLTEYRYSFLDDELIIEKILGNRVTPVVNIRTWDIEFFGHISDSDWKNDDIQITSCDIDKTNAYVIAYTKDEVKYAITFSPTENFIQQLQTAIDTIHYEQMEEDTIIK